ncbi:hypothetical protein H8E52_10945, partial [bacterium]|nr:hypothetical protein [bacterium]
VSIIIGLFVLIALVACSQDEIEGFRITQEQKAQGFVPGPLAFDVEITLARSVSKKTGKPVGVGEHFGVEDGSKVRAFVTARNLNPDRVHSFHLVWLKPGDLKESFRKYAEVSLEEVEGGWKKQILWKKAEDLTHFDEEIQEGEEPGVIMSTVMNVAPEKLRDLGLYTFRIYYNRELLTEKTFELVGQEIIFDGPGGGPFLMEKEAEVTAAVRLTGLEVDKEYAAELVWHKPGGKKLFAKEFSVVAGADSSATLEGKLDISKKKKRKAGKYELKVYLEGSLVAREKFKLVKP